MAIILILLILLLLFGSKFLPSMGERLGKKSRKPYRQAKWIWSWVSGTEDESIRAEREYGRECAREFAKQFSDHPLPGDQELVGTIGSRLAEALKDQRREFRFTVVSSGTANAFALPGGFIYITKPLLDLCSKDSNEIAFFLGHEMAHVVRGHAREQMTAGTLLNAITARLPKAGPMLRQMAGKGYSRSLELEADREAVRLAAAAGFDAEACVRALEHLSRVAPDNEGFAEYFSSHPSFSERLHKLEKSIGK